jgi:hypothetical protein
MEAKLVAVFKGFPNLKKLHVLKKEQYFPLNI